MARVWPRGEGGQKGGFASETRVSGAERLVSGGETYVSAGEMHVSGAETLVFVTETRGFGGSVGFIEYALFTPRSRMPTRLCPTHGLRYDPEVSSGCIRCPRVAASSPSASSPGVSRRGLLVGTTCLAATAAGVGALYQYREQLAPSFFSDDVSDIVFADGQTGSLFEPPGVLPTVAAPLILLFDPNGLAHYIVNRYSAGARRLGWIVASPTAVKNDTRYADDTARMTELLAFVRARRVVDSTRIFTGGFSGGACLAYRFVLLFPALFAGAVVESGHMEPWREAGSRASSASCFFLHTRTDDFNRPATGDLERVMREKGCRVTKLERPGGHDPMDSADVDAALTWLTA